MKSYKVFSTSLIDIDKVLTRKKYTDLINKLLKRLYKHLKLFNELVTEKLPTYQKGVNYKINLLKNE